MSASTLWWVVAGSLVAVELMVGTFYLLMIALGAVAGALAAHAGLGLVTQVVTAAVISAGATAIWHYRRARSPRSAPVQSNQDVMLDIGQVVQVPGWDADGSARVQYRGASWSVRYSGNGTPQPGPHVIVAVQGIEFLVQPGVAG